MAEEEPGAEKGTEDIVQRLEALRKRAPAEEGDEVPVPEPEGDESKGPLSGDRRKTIARVVGILVIVLMVFFVLFAGYKVIYKPIQKKMTEEKMIEHELEQTLVNARNEKFNEINSAFVGLPSEYIISKSDLLNELKKANSLEKINAIYVAGPADESWRSYRTDQLDEISKTTDNVKMTIGNDTYRGYNKVQQKIEQFGYQTLKTISLLEYSSEYFPIRLTREQAAGGWAEQGNLINIWLREEDTSSILARNARVVAVLRGSSSGLISLTESESKTASGAGAEGKGTVSSISAGGVGNIPGTFPAAAGYKTTQTATAFSVDIIQVQKAAAASKLPEDYIEEVLGNYGVKLNRIEASTGIADFGAEYIILFEVGEEDVPGLITYATPSSSERGNVFITIARPSEWIDN